MWHVPHHGVSLGRWEGHGWSNITHIESGEAICSQNGIQNRFKGAQFLTVFDSGDKYTDALETQFFSKVGIDWIGIEMSGPPLVLTEVIEEE